MNFFFILFSFVVSRLDPNEQLPSPYPDQFNEILNALSPTQPIISPHSPSIISYGMHSFIALFLLNFYSNSSSNTIGYASIKSK